MCRKLCTKLNNDPSPKLFIFHLSAKICLYFSKQSNKELKLLLEIQFTKYWNSKGLYLVSKHGGKAVGFIAGLAQLFKDTV